MKEQGFYIIKGEFFDLIRELGGEWNDKNADKRPVYCCIPDREVEGLYWAIPTSDLKHRSDEQKAKYDECINAPEDDERWAYYFKGRTNRACLYKISTCIPVTEKYIDHEFTVNEEHYILYKKKDIEEINKRFKKILCIEGREPNSKFPQHITAIKNYLIGELNQNQGNAEVAVSEEEIKTEE